MSKDAKELERLAKELADLTPEERATVISAATQADRFRPFPQGWKPPVLAGGTHWDGGPLTREDLYGDDGR
ncbi:MAG TPA: hypothetical protein VGK67_25690 [Myxococcales bacterium]|jgi:hypothetical protein